MEEYVLKILNNPKLNFRLIFV